MGEGGSERILEVHQYYRRKVEREGTIREIEENLKRKGTKAGEGFKRSAVSNVEKGSSKMRNKACLGFDNLKPIGHVYLSRLTGNLCGGLSSGATRE